MAKKRKDKPEEEELDFKLPKFDEGKFLAKERRNIKTLFISFLFGFLIALISFGFWTLLSDSAFRWELVLLLGVFNISWLKYLFLRLNIDLTDFGRRGWFSSFAIYFFTWLIVLIVLVNPPFYDAESAQVDVVLLPGMQELGGSVVIVAHITDNVGVEDEGITFTLTDPNEVAVNPVFSFSDNVFRYTFENPDSLIGEFNFTLRVADVSGHITEETGVFVYGNTTLEITSSRFTDIRSGDSILIKADERICENNFRVFYQVDNGAEINVSRKDAEEKDEYETSPEYQGWRENSNVTVTVLAEVTHYFVNVDERFNNTIQDTHMYNFSTGADANIGKEPVLGLEDLKYSLPRPISVGATPGFELIVCILSLVVVVVLFKYRKKDKKL